MSEENLYRNAALYMKKGGFIKSDRIDIDPFDGETLQWLQKIANSKNQDVYVIREFIANDAEYQEKRPEQLASDWYVMKVEPESESCIQNH
jgi:hypothetical protein